MDNLNKNMKNNSNPKYIFLLNIALRSIERWLETQPNRLAAMSSAQAGAVFYLEHHDGALIGEVAQALRVGASAMSGLANRLEKAGFVKRAHHPIDNRAIRLYLTEEGKTAAKQAKTTLALLNPKLKEGFTEAEMKIVACWLDTLPNKFKR